AQQCQLAVIAGRINVADVVAGSLQGDLGSMEPAYADRKNAHHSVLTCWLPMLSAGAGLTLWFVLASRSIVRVESHLALTHWRLLKSRVPDDTSPRRK